jgi:hypothetical protein
MTTSPNEDWLDEAIIYSGKHAGHWDDNLSKMVRDGKTNRLILDIPTLKAAIQQHIVEAKTAGKWEIVKLAAERVHDDPEYTLDAFVEDAQEYLTRLAELQAGQEGTV